MIRPGFIVTAAPILFLGVATPRPQIETDAGLTYDFTVALYRTGPDGESSGGVGLRGHASVVGDHVRIDFDSQASPPGMAGGYFLSNDAGAHAIIVATDKHQAIEMPMPALVQKFGNSSGNFGGLLNQATDVHIDVQDMGAASPIFGQPTMHYRLVEAKTINGQIPDAALRQRDSLVSDLYYAPALKNFINPFLLEPPFAGSLDGLGPEDKQRYLAARARLYPSMAPLRTISREIITKADGTVISIGIVTMVTRLKSVDVDPSLFDIPAGYSKTTAQAPQ
jgi:hypothetical protein